MTSKTEPLIQMFIDDKVDKHISNASCEVRWCLEPALLALIEEKSMLHPHLIVSVINKSRGELSRQIVPIEQGSTFVTFDRGGLNTVSAILVFGQRPRKFKATYKNINDITLYNYDSGDSGDAYVPWSIVFDGSDTYFSRNDVIDVHACIDVIVDKELFAREPNELVEYFTNLWYESDPRDQCQFRQRFLITLFLKIFPIAAWTIFQVFTRTIVALFVSGAGYRKVCWKAIVHPWGLPFAAITHNVDSKNNYLIRGDLTQDKVSTLTIWLWLLSPSLWVCGVLPIAHLISTADPDVVFIEAVLATVGAFAGFGIIALGVALFCVNSAGIALRAERVILKVVDTVLVPVLWLIQRYDRDLTAKEIQAIRNKQRLTPLACPKDSSTVIPSANATVQQRVVLTFQRTKAKVCKPFPK